MIRRLAYPVVLLASRWLDQTVPVERLHALLRRGLDDWLKRLAAQSLPRGPSSGADVRPALGPDSGNAAIPRAVAWQDEIALACRLAFQAGLVPSDQPSAPLAAGDRTPPAREPEASLQAAIQRWIEGVPEGKVVTAKRLVAGTGWWLDRIDSAGHGTRHPFVERSLELLLRHVEIRAERCLEPIEPPITARLTWLEKHDVAILFARSARRRKDGRLLSAAMKLNDRAYRAHRRPPVSPRFLLALAEQERTVQELLR